MTDEERKDYEDGVARMKVRREELKEKLEEEKKKPLFPTVTEEQQLERQEKFRDEMVNTLTLNWLLFDLKQ